MMLSSLSKRMALLAIIAIASAGTSLHAEKALVVFEPSALTPVEPWDGSTAIEPRANTALVVAFIGGGFLLTSNAVTNTCTLAIAAGNLPLCAAAIAAAATGAAIAFLAAYAGGHQPDKREEDQFLWRYPMLDSGPPMKDQVMAAFAGGDGSPVFMGTSGSEQFTNHDLWYSNTFNLTGRGKYVHRVHATPVKSDDPGRRKRTLLERQSGSEQATEQGYTGGYVWEDAQINAEAQGIFAESQTDFEQNIVNQMSSEYDANGAWGHEGIGCMSFDATTDPTPVTYGYLWYYADASSYNSANEASYLNTCSETAIQQRRMAA